VAGDFDLDDWHEAVDDGSWAKAWDACQSAAQRLNEWPPSGRGGAIRRIGLCYAQLMLAADPEWLPETTILIMGELLREAEPLIDSDH
jgi:hypothetical protein